MVFVQIYISGPGPWSSQSVSYFSGQWSRSATGGIHARPNFPGFSCLATFVIYTTTQTQTHLRQNIAKRKNKFSRLFPPACYLYKSEHKKTTSLKSLVLTLFSPPAVSGCTGNHFSSQRLFKINFLCVRSNFLYNKKITLFNINCQGFLNSNFFPPTEILLSPWATGTILQSSFHFHRKWNHPSSREQPFCIVRKWEQKTAIFITKKIVILHFTFTFFKKWNNLFCHDSLPCLGGVSLKIIFLAVQDSSIGDIVTEWVSEVTFDLATPSNP